MDEVITCGCTSQKWVIGTSGVRCADCGFWLSPREGLSKSYSLPVEEVNRDIAAELKRRAAISQEPQAPYKTP